MEQRKKFADENLLYFAVFLLVFFVAVMCVQRHIAHQKTFCSRVFFFSGFRLFLLLEQ
jgi:hypothetical protein